MSKTDFDVIVAGGGPAGCMAAFEAAKGGVRTLLLERDANIGLPVRCGELISIRNIRDILDFPEKIISRRVENLVAVAPDGGQIEARGFGLDFATVERNLFDRYIAEKAAESGAEIQTRSIVSGLIKNEDEKVCGVRIERLGKTVSLRAKIVIGADGVESQVGKWAGVLPALTHSQLASAYQKTLHGLDIDVNSAYIYFSRAYAHGGIIWVLPKRGSIANVGIGVDSDTGGVHRAKDLLDIFIEHHFPGSSVVSESAGSLPIDKPPAKTYTDGVIIAGDAARHCNPLSGAGICSGMISGGQAGITAAEAVLNDNYSANALSAFQDRIRNKFVLQHNREYRIAKAFRKFDDNFLNSLAKVIREIPVEERTHRRILLKTFTSQPHLFLDIMKAFI